MSHGFVVAAPRSGEGKTTVVLGLLGALKSRGLDVRSFKTGPDYIDPAHHELVTGRVSHNLDTWMLPADVNHRIFEAGRAGGDVAVVEGVMGLFDSISGVSPIGSTGHLASELDLPVILIVDARSMARSAAALVSGFANFDPRVRIAGVIWNRVGSQTHRRMLDEALVSCDLPPSLGAIPRDEEVELAERHLGLVTPEDAGPIEGRLAKMAGLVAQHVDLSKLLALSPLPGTTKSTGTVSAGTRVMAVARDRAYCFYYEENFAILRSQGWRLEFFKPTEGDGLPPDVEAVYLGGGYPELNGERISRNLTFLDGLRAAHERNTPIYGECGGFMTLCASLEDTGGNRFPMAGIFPAEARMSARGFRLGYREVTGVPGSVVDGLTARGHEFHYSRVDDMPDSVFRAYWVASARGDSLDSEGYSVGRTMGGYNHLHFGSSEEFPRRIFG